MAADKGKKFGKTGRDGRWELQNSKTRNPKAINMTCTYHVDLAFGTCHVNRFWYMPC